MTLSMEERSKQVKINPLTIGKIKIFNMYEPPTMCLATFWAFPPSFNLQSNPENTVMFSLFFQMRPGEVRGVSRLREQGGGLSEDEE